MESAVQLLSEGRQGDVAAALDLLELQSALPPLENPAWPCSLHLLGHMYNGNLEDARFLWKRIPPHTKQNNPELEAAWLLLQHLWNQDHAAAWQVLNSFAWSPATTPLTNALVSKLRRDALSLISTAYSSIVVSKVALMCGVSEQQASALCTEAGWVAEAGSAPAVVQVLPPAAAAADGADQQQAQQRQLDALAEYMLHLETP